MTDTIIRLERDSVVDTSGFEDMLIAIRPGCVRETGSIPDDLSRTLGRLVMGHPVQRAHLDRWGVRVMKVHEMDEVPGSVRPTGPGSLKSDD